MCRWNPGAESRWRSGEDERQHDENRMRDIHFGRRASETTHEKQPDKLKNKSTIKAKIPSNAEIACEW